MLDRIFCIPNHSMQRMRASRFAQFSAEEEALEFARQIPELAERHRRLAKETFGLELNYEPESIALLDRMVREGWPDPPAMLQTVVTGFGSYLGETGLRCVVPAHPFRQPYMVLDSLAARSLTLRASTPSNSFRACPRRSSLFVGSSALTSGFLPTKPRGSGVASV
jgi:hypothetical protein